MAYTPGSGDDLSEKQLKWGVWWVYNRAKVKTGFTVVLGVLAFALFAYGAWGFADWFLGSGVRERAEIGLMSRSWTDYGYFRTAAAPKALVAESAQVIPAGEGRYDLIAKVQNPNHRWLMEVTYQFTGGVSDRVRTAYVLPTETRLIYSLGVEAGSRPSPKLEILGVGTYQVDNHVVRPDYVTWAADRLNFRYESIEFTPPDPKSAVPVSRVSFEVHNDSAFGFNSVPFIVTLLSGTKIVGVNRVVITDLYPGEMRGVEASWFNDLPNVTRVEVQPELNILDPAVFMRLGT